MPTISKAEYDRRKAAMKVGIVKNLKTTTTAGVRKSLAGGEYVEVVAPTPDTISVIKYLRGAAFNLWDGADAEKGLFQKALAAGSGTTGGFTVAPMIVEAIIPAMRETAKVRGLPGVQVLPVTDALEAEYTFEDNDPAVTWGTENSLVSEQGTTDLFGKRTLAIKRCQSLVYVSRELIRTSKINMEQNIRSRLGSSLGLEEDAVILQGLGGTRPMGIYYNPRVVSTDLSGTLDADTFRNAEYNVRLNQAEINAWIAHPRTAVDVSKLKDANGRPIFPEMSGPGITGGQVLSVFGKPLRQTTKIGITGYPSSNESYMVGADWSKLVIGDGPMEMETTTQGGNAFLYHQLGIILFKYVGTCPMQPGAFVVVKGIQAVS